MRDEKKKPFIGSMIKEKKELSIAEVWADLDEHSKDLDKNPPKWGVELKKILRKIHKKTGEYYSTILSHIPKHIHINIHTEKIVAPVIGFVKKNKKAAVVACILIVVAVVGGNMGNGSKNKSKTDQLGVKTTSTGNESGLSGELPKVDDSSELQFKIVLPVDKSFNSAKVVKVNPESSATVYAYLDKVGDIDIKVTQQELPESFNIERDKKLKDLADGFQMSNIIQIDDMTVYHGLNEKSNIQSLAFIKYELLIFISADQKISDDQWAGYISSLRETE